jgi:5-methylcytosine-specific restriction endonuclease McrA
MTTCLALRLTHNDNMWVKPSKGRLYQSDDYVGETGFGHEDWNFNLEQFKGDYTWGFQRFVFKNKERHKENFNLCFYDYDKKRKAYFVVGFYLDAQYVPKGMPFDETLFLQKKNDLISLGDSLSESYYRSIDTKLKEDFQYYCWKVLKRNVIKLECPIQYPQHIRQLKCKRYATAMGLTDDEFERILEYVKNANSEYINIDYDAFPEGEEKLAIHKNRERNYKLINQKKAEFKTSHNGKLYCEACGLNFEEVYGEYGKDFIEVHHIIPISESVENRKTKLEDLVLLCSNCHRMVHHRRPWLNKDQLKSLLKK